MSINKFKKIDKFIILKMLTNNVTTIEQFIEPLQEQLGEWATNLVAKAPLVMEEEKRGGLPSIIVAPVFLAAWAWEALAVTIMALPVWAPIWALAFSDWLMDWVFVLTFGLFCKPCAGIFIWLINIVYIPFYVIALGLRFITETWGLFVDGWLLAFGLSGCYMFVGKHCGLLKPKGYRTRMDIPVLNALMAGDKDQLWQQVKDLVTPPTIESNSEFLQVRHENRKRAFGLLPVASTILPLLDGLYEHFDF